jgi:hypothetical protein
MARDCSTFDGVQRRRHLNERLRAAFIVGGRGQGAQADRATAKRGSVTEPSDSKGTAGPVKTPSRLVGVPCLVPTSASVASPRSITRSTGSIGLQPSSRSLGETMKQLLVLGAVTSVIAGCFGIQTGPILTEHPPNIQTSPPTSGPAT